MRWQRRIQAARVCEDDALHVCATFRKRSSRLTSAAARGAPRAMIRIVSSPAIVPDDLGEPRAVERDGQRLRLAGAGPDDDQLLHPFDAPQELRGGALERRQRRFRAVASAPGR